MTPPDADKARLAEIEAVGKSWQKAYERKHPSREEYGKLYPSVLDACAIARRAMEAHTLEQQMRVMAETRAERAEAARDRATSWANDVIKERDAARAANGELITSWANDIAARNAVYDQARSQAEKAEIDYHTMHAERDHAYKERDAVLAENRTLNDRMSKMLLHDGEARSQAEALRAAFVEVIGRYHVYMHDVTTEFDGRTPCEQRPCKEARAALSRPSQSWEPKHCTCNYSDYGNGVIADPECPTHKAPLEGADGGGPGKATERTQEGSTPSPTPAKPAGVAKCPGGWEDFNSHCQLCGKHRLQHEPAHKPAPPPPMECETRVIDGQLWCVAHNVRQDVSCSSKGA